MTPIVRNIKNEQLYFYLGDNVFENISSGQSGKVSDAAAQKTFRINYDAMAILNEYPNVIKLIQQLNLKCDAMVDTEKQSN